MDVLAAILTCSLYADDALVRAIVDNAHDNPLVLFTPELDPTTGATSNTPETIDAAVAQLREITTHGGRPLIGLMQVPLTWASTFGRDAADLFDPCINVSIGTSMLSEFDYECARSSARTAPRVTASAANRISRRNCAVERYAQTILMPELATVAKLGMHYQHPNSGVPTDAPIFPPSGEQRRWGSDCLFIAKIVAARESRSVEPKDHRK